MCIIVHPQRHIVISSKQTAGSLSVFILAMTLYPEIMRRAQAQIDAVVGRDRLPNFGDRAQLPYIEAVVKEVQRWRPGAPISVPRQTTEVGFEVVKPHQDA